MIQVRFDDLKSVPERAFRFTGLEGVIEARRREEVPKALEALDAAAAAGRWVAGYIAYEAAPGIDSDLVVRDRAPRDPFAAMPLIWFGIFRERKKAGALEPPNASYSVAKWEPSVPRSLYEAEIERIRDFIKAGDTYQVNHTMRLRSTMSGTDNAYYTALCLAQRGGNCAYINIGRYRILSASPELFFALDDAGRLVTRPMKGTAPRGRFVEEDEARTAALVASAKERAENAMIVDLLRNDMGRISEAGSVKVSSLFDVEKYETVWQLTSSVESQLRAGVGPAGALRALFPSGSVTGAPKVRSMQIIAELEDSPRGAYTGAAGWIAPDGCAEFGVSIRTVVLDTETGTVEYGVGGGITHDSIPAREYEECIAKARVLGERRPEFRLFETIARRDDELVHMDRHIERIAKSAEYFGFMFDASAFSSAVAGAAARAGPKGHVVVRAELSRDGSIATSTRPLPGATEERAEPVRLATDDRPVDPQDVFLFHKTTERRAYTDRTARHPEVDDVVLVNNRGEVTETTIANIALKLGGQWLTPPRESGLLAGTLRAELLEAGELTERTITVDELRRAREIQVVSSVRGRREATLIQ
jgi:para-aminobenzoate synthetase/4-amino-4-deoxychorismate lyase